MDSHSLHISKVNHICFLAAPMANKQSSDNIWQCQQYKHLQFVLTYVSIAKYVLKNLLSESKIVIGSHI
jgi:hypothetical protein